MTLWMMMMMMKFNLNVLFNVQSPHMVGRCDHSMTQ
jgi:hypothetical protein